MLAKMIAIKDVKFTFNFFFKSTHCITLTIGRLFLKSFKISFIKSIPKVLNNINSDIKSLAKMINVTLRFEPIRIFLHVNKSWLTVYSKVLEIHVNMSQNR